MSGNYEAAEGVLNLPFRVRRRAFVRELPLCSMRVRATSVDRGCWATKIQAQAVKNEILQRRQWEFNEVCVRSVARL